MKVFTIAFKDIKMHLKSPWIILSILLSSIPIVGLRILFDFIRIQGIAFPLPFLLNLIFTLTLPFLGLALLLLNADVLAKEHSEGTILILFSQPVSNASIVIGKFMAVFSTSIIFTSINALLMKLLFPVVWEVTGFVSEGQILASFFLAALTFQLPIMGLTLLFSSLLKRSAIVTIIVTLIYELLAIMYSSQIILTLPIPLAAGREIIQVLTILLGSILGYTMYALGWMVPVPGFTIQEPSIIKYIPINVNAQRLFYFLTSPRSPRPDISEVAISVFSLIAITAITLLISLLVVRKARSEYLE